MRSDDLVSLMAQGESETVEFNKSTAVMRDIIETICAFANHKGGSVFIGIKDDGQVLGQTVSDDTLKNLSNAIKLNTEPKIFPEVTKVEIEGKTCILIHVSESPLKPHFAFGRPFSRIGPTTQRLSPDMLEVMLLQKQNGFRFDNQLCKDASWDEIDEKAVYQFAEQANYIRNLNINLTLTAKELLHSLEFAKDDFLTNAAILLFGKNPSKYFLGQYEIKCGVFPDETSYDFMLDDHEYSDNLIANFNAALSFVYRHVNIEFRKNGFAGETKFEFTDAVVREALVNMIVHKDYRRGIKNYVEIRPGWIRFSNPGFLFKPDITIEKLYVPHTSRPGNRLLAKAFFWLGLFENWGGGTLKIIEEIKKTGKTAPEFTFGDDEIFRLKLYRN